MYYLLGFRLIEASNKFVMELLSQKGDQKHEEKNQETSKQPVNKSISWLKSAVKKYHATEHFARSKVFHDMMSEPLVQQVRCIWCCLILFCLVLWLVLSCG